MSNLTIICKSNIKYQHKHCIELFRTNKMHTYQGSLLSFLLDESSKEIVQNTKRGFLSQFFGKQLVKVLNSQSILLHHDSTK